MKKLTILANNILILLIAPIIYFLSQTLSFNQLEQYHLPIYTYLLNTLFIVVIVAICSVGLGSGLAWIITTYKMRYRTFFKVLFALPLAFPPYIMAHAYGDFFQYGGLFYTFTNNHIDILNIYGAIFVYIITLYPYVYILCLGFYSNFNGVLIETAKTLQTSPIKIFFKVGLPIAYVPIISGVSLVILELLSDFGVVEYYGVPVFSTAIYKLWSNYSDTIATVKLALIAVVVVLFVFYCLQMLKQRNRYFVISKSNRIAYIGKLSLWIKLLIIGFVLIALFIPTVQMIVKSLVVSELWFNKNTWLYIWNTLWICLIGALISSGIAFFVAYVFREKTSKLSHLALLGYGIPGIIVAIAVLYTFIQIDNVLNPIYKNFSLPSRMLQTSVFVLIFAYIVRFLGVAMQNMHSSYQKINKNIFKMSQLLEKNRWNRFIQIDVPLLRRPFFYTVILIFLEILKELPITLMLKHFSIQTITTKIYEYIHNEQSNVAAFYSIIIVLIATLAVVFLMVYKESSYARVEKSEF